MQIKYILNLNDLDFFYKYFGDVLFDSFDKNINNSIVNHPDVVSRAHRVLFDGKPKPYINGGIFYIPPLTEYTRGMWIDVIKSPHYNHWNLYFATVKDVAELYNLLESRIDTVYCDVRKYQEFIDYIDTIVALENRNSSRDACNIHHNVLKKIPDLLRREKDVKKQNDLYNIYIHGYSVSVEDMYQTLLYINRKDLIIDIVTRYPEELAQLLPDELIEAAVAKLNKKSSVVFFLRNENIYKHPESLISIIKVMSRAKTATIRSPIYSVKVPDEVIINELTSKQVYNLVHFHIDKDGESILDMDVNSVLNKLLPVITCKPELKNIIYEKLQNYRIRKRFRINNTQLLDKILGNSSDIPGVVERIMSIISDRNLLKEMFIFLIDFYKNNQTSSIIADYMDTLMKVLECIEYKKISTP